MYSHYFTVNVLSDDDDRRFAEFAAEAKDIITFAVQRGINIADATGQVLNGWVVSDDTVEFNGYDEDSYETFRFDREQGLGFFLCKTAQMPYDAVVTACLIALKNAYGESVDIDSSGDWETDWIAGRYLYQMAVQRSAWSPIRQNITA